MLASKLPIQYCTRINCDQSDWNAAEVKILGDINLAMPVMIYDNGIWSPKDASFRAYDKPFEGHLLYTPGPLLQARFPEYQEVVRRGRIDQDLYNGLIERRIAPLFKYACEKAGQTGKKALITIPGLGCGVFGGKFKGSLGPILRLAIINVLRQHGKELKNIALVNFDPYIECTKEDLLVNDIKFRVRPSFLTPDRTQLSSPLAHQEGDDDFSNVELYKFVAWDHVSLPGNSFFKGIRDTDDGTSSAATDSMYRITGLHGNYVTRLGKYMQPREFKNWGEVCSQRNISLVIIDGLKVY